MEKVCGVVAALLLLVAGFAALARLEGGFLMGAIDAVHHLAYRVTAGDQKGEVVRQFDPQAGRIIMAPPMAGG